MPDMMELDQRVVAQLIQAIKEPKIKALCGPPGTGKLTLMKKLVLHLGVYFLEHVITTEKQFIALRNKMGSIPLDMEGQNAVWF